MKKITTTKRLNINIKQLKKKHVILTNSIKIISIANLILIEIFS